MPDAVIIGSGPNGLVAANVLADAGWSVLVLEAAPDPGGAVRSGEVAAPGYVSDRYSSFHPLAVLSPAMVSMHLHDYGLRWARSAIPLAHPRPDGHAAYIGATVNDTVAGLDAITPGDGAGWRDLAALWARVGDALLDSVLRPFPPVVPAARLATTLGVRGTADFTRFAVMPVRRAMQEHFTGEDAALLFAGNTAHTDLTLDSAGSALYAWILASSAQQVGFPTPVGGAGALTAALIARLTARGGVVQCDSRVVRVLVRDRRAVGVVLADGTEIDASRAVIADVNAPTLFLDLVGAAHLPGAYLDRFSKFHWDHGTVKVDWALRRPVPWTAPEARRAGTLHIADSMEQLGVAMVQLESGNIPARPFLLVGQPDLADPTRCPPGHGTLWAYAHVPQHVRGDAGGTITGAWDASDTDRFVGRMESIIEEYAPGFKELVVGRHVESPRTLQAGNANLVGGAVNGGTNALHQQLIFRPTLGLAGPRTPVRGLYLGSASAHPGGGVHGACGNNAARAALAADARRRIAGFVTSRLPSRDSSD